MSSTSSYDKEDEKVSKAKKVKTTTAKNGRKAALG
jgi:hypothetical protein